MEAVEEALEVETEEEVVVVWVEDAEVVTVEAKVAASKEVVEVVNPTSIRDLEIGYAL